MKEKINLLDKDFSQMRNLMKQLGLPAFRAQQLFNWIYSSKISSFASMDNLPQSMIALLEEKTCFDPLKIISAQRSKDGTRKFLFELEDKKLIESVYLPYKGVRTSVCLSTQAGCAMGCSFCATAKQPLKRNLSCAEIVNQLLTIEKKVSRRISNIVLMGMGEPLANYSNVLKAVSIMNHKDGLDVAMRRITVSTCGLVKKIYKLAEEKLQLTLAVSLNAATDDLRDTLMPVNKKYPLNELMKACRHYAASTGRRVSFEYVMIKGVNDSRDQAIALASILKGTLSHVNLIRLNPVPSIKMQPAATGAIDMFKAILEMRTIPVSIRQERGKDIDAACGQLSGRKTLNLKRPPDSHSHKI